MYEDSRSLPRNPYVPFQMPAWNHWSELRAYKDIPWLDNGDLGPINVTLPDWKTKDLRQAYYSSISHVDHEIGRVGDSGAGREHHHSLVGGPWVAALRTF